ncbi:hypothetical protein FTO74_13730 [Granulicella sp. WH15]|nr:hypothetical protein FTO74_13730 [Granulicella sp. WH15]
MTDHTGAPVAQQNRGWLLSLTSFLLILLQSVCTAVITISGLRFLIGLSSLAAASFIPGFAFTLHTGIVRVPMIVFAILGSVLNLYVVWRIRSLRARPAAQWRMQPISARQRRSETVQIALSVVTLLLVVAESLAHHILHGSY